MFKNHEEKFLGCILECTTHMALKMLPRKDDRSYIYSSKLRRILHLLRDLMPTINRHQHSSLKYASKPPMVPLIGI
jgi:hypothetical protein